MTDDRPLLSATEVAERLNIGTRTVWKMLKAGDIPSIKVGQLRRVRPADLDAYVAQPTPHRPGRTGLPVQAHLGHVPHPSRSAPRSSEEGNA